MSWSNLSFFSECPGVTFHFPYFNTKDDWVQYKSYIPMMRKMTVCAWLDVTALSSSTHQRIFNYSNSASDFSSLNVFLLNRTNTFLGIGECNRSNWNLYIGSSKQKVLVFLRFKLILNFQ